MNKILVEITAGAETTETGLQYFILNEGSGSSPKKGDNVSVHYSGFLLDGTMFDSSYERDRPITFPLGEGRVIPGWDEGISLLKVGSKAKFIIPSNLAYGDTTTSDPQTGTTDVLTYSDMVDTGKILGPRVYSTGPGVGYWGYNFKSLDEAKDALKQYSKYYNTKTIKMYRAGNRQQRQWI